MRKTIFLFAILMILSSLVACGRTANNPSISAEEAIQIAADEANVNRSNLSRVSAALERENGVLVYDVDFVVGAAEYSFEINAKNGKIVSVGD